MTPSANLYLSLFVGMVLFQFCEAAAQPAGALSIGAARANITPPADAALQLSGYSGRTDGFTGIHDSLYYRVIVIDNGETQAALVVGDVLFIHNDWWEHLAARIEQEAGIRRDNLLLVATHTHGAPRSIYRMEDPDEKLIAYTDETADRIVSAVHAAMATTEPARIGIGRGEANINISRVAPTGQGGYWLGMDPDGPSDKTVHVVTFESLDGRPLAVLINYAVHGVVSGPGNYLVTADLPGATSRYVREQLGGDVVIAWTSGAAGDQNPIYSVETDFNSGRIPSLDVQGQILGEEVVRIIDEIQDGNARVSVSGRQKVVTVPGKEPTEFNPRGDYEFIDSDPVDIRLSLLMVNYVAFACVSGEVLTRIGMRLKEESPLKETMMITHCNGWSGYLPDDATYGRPGYEIMVTRVKEGAEDAIIQGLLDLMQAP